ncbi:hypothetical protein ACPCHT_21930 [Nucisporomicrobium flavum]|uniref:hypothetical protein n=1 Tax=Nucisporomicrobium flavum TaxID=2785915 RepID=UPI003C2F7A30
MSSSRHDRTTRAADMMHLNAMALEETEQSLHTSADQRSGAAGERLHRLADTMTETAGDIAERARGLSDEAKKREPRG